MCVRTLPGTRRFPPHHVTTATPQPVPPVTSPVVQPISGVVQHYAWGDTDFIPRLLGVEPDGRPWAELWLGTHPNGPRRSRMAGVARVGGELSYMLKVLAAEQPLSLQVHPNAEQAVDGFARGAYPDANPKPELFCALTPVEAFCGVRPVERTVALLHELGYRRRGPAASRRTAWVRWSRRPVRGSVDAQPLIDACAGHDRIEACWVRRLDAMYPGEPSVAVTLLLNLVVLEPGQALRLDAGNLHAYLPGRGSS